MNTNLNTYISVSFLAYSDRPAWNSGRLFIAKGEEKLHQDISYEQARREMAKLMLRLGKLPDVIGKEDNDGCLMYILTGFLD